MSYCWPVHVPFCYTGQQINVKSDKCASWPWFNNNLKKNTHTQRRVTGFWTAGYTSKYRFLHWSHVLLSEMPAHWERLLFTPSRAIRSSASCPRTPRHDDCRGRRMKHYSVNVYSVCHVTRWVYSCQQSKRICTVSEKRNRTEWKFLRFITLNI